MEKLVKYNRIVDAVLLGIMVLSLIVDFGIHYLYFVLVFVVGGGMLRVYAGRQMPLLGMVHHIFVFVAAILGRLGYSFPLSAMVFEFYIFMGLIYFLGEPLFFILNGCFGSRLLLGLLLFAEH